MKFNFMFKRYLITGLILIGSLALTGAGHKFYVSITQIDVVADSHKLEISARIFTDDLEASVQEATGQKLRMGSGKEHPKADSLLYDYLLSQLTIKQDNIPLKLIYIGKEVESDVTWIYLESSEGISTEKPLSIRNSLLQDLFPDQKNLVNVKLGKQTISQIHSKSHPEFPFTLQRL